jgi:hypothetical protein
MKIVRGILEILKRLWLISCGLIIIILTTAFLPYVIEYCSKLYLKTTGWEAIFWKILPAWFLITAFIAGMVISTWGQAKDKPSKDDKLEEK